MDDENNSVNAVSRAVSKALSEAKFYIFSANDILRPKEWSYFSSKDQYLIEFITMTFSITSVVLFLIPISN
jgi:hypothetical protein